MVRLVCAWNAWSNGGTLTWLLENAVVDPELSGRRSGGDASGPPQRPASPPTQRVCVRLLTNVCLYQSHRVICARSIKMHEMPYASRCMYPRYQTCSSYIHTFCTQASSTQRSTPRLSLPKKTPTCALPRLASSSGSGHRTPALVPGSSARNPSTSRHGSSSSGAPGGSVASGLDFEAIPTVLYLPRSSITRRTRPKHCSSTALTINPNAHDAVVGATVRTGKYEVPVTVTVVPSTHDESASANGGGKRSTKNQQRVVVDDWPPSRAASWRPKYADRRACGVRFLCRRMYEHVPTPARDKIVKYADRQPLPHFQNTRAQNPAGDGADTGVVTGASGSDPNQGTIGGPGDEKSNGTGGAIHDGGSREGSYDLWYILYPNDITLTPAQ